MSKPTLLERISAHYNEQTDLMVRSDAWDEDFYFKPLTPREAARLTKMSGGDEVEFGVRFLIEKALNANGERLFDDDAKTLGLLMKGSMIREVGRIVRLANPEEETGATTKND